MEEEGEYADGEIVWVKLSYCWWPGEILAGSRLTDEFLSTLKRRPLAVVKFFDEDSYEFVKNTNFIYKYNCNRKNEFLRKGLEQYRAKNKHMVKFPADVMQAERATGGDPNIVNSTEFLPQKRESYADIFSPDKSKGGKGKASATTPRGSPKKAPVISPSKIIPVIPVRKHEVRILGQASSPSGIASRSSLGLSSLSNSSLNASTSSSVGEPGSSLLSSSVSAAVSPSQIYHCHKCGFESSRQNVIVLHTKYCRAVPLAPFNIPAVRESKSLQSTTSRTTSVDPITPKAAPKLPDEPPQLQPATPEDGEELVEVIQVVQEKTTSGRAGRTPRAIAKAATPTPKVDRKKTRGGRGKSVATPEVEVTALDDEEKVEECQVSEEPPVEDVSVQEVEKSLDDSTGKDSKAKADVELKNELLADWSEDEQDEQELKEDKMKATSSDEAEKVESTETAAPVISVTDAGADKSVESSPQLASPVSSSSGTTIKYRNIPKKQKREFIEVTNDQPATTVAVTIEKSSSESSISTAATCGDKTASSSSADSLPEQSRPLSAKQRILDRATRGSSKSNSSSTEELKPVVVAAATAQAESQHDTSAASTIDETKKDIASCFDFKEEEEEEVVLSKSPRRSLSNRRDVSLDAKQEQEELERAKKDAELNNEIDSLLSEVTVPSLPELPKLPASPRASSPGPSQDIISPQSKEEIDRNRTLPPKERGKRIFKTRNKPTVENEAIALEQSKAIVLDFVKKSHEEEEAQQQQEAKLSSESPTTTNDDSQESVLSTVADQPKFENSEFAAIKAKRTKLPVEEDPPKEEESTVSSSNEEPKPALEETESIPVSISKDQLALEVLEKTTPSPMSRKAKQQPSKQTVVSPIVLIEKLPDQEPVEEQLEVTSKTARKKRVSEMDQADQPPRSRRGRSAKVEEPTPPEQEPPKEIEPVAPVVPKSQRKVKRAKKDEQIPPAEETPEVEPKPSKSKRSKQSQQRSADSTADLHAEIDPVVPSAAEHAPVEPVVNEPPPTAEEPVVAKHQPIKMIIKSKGKKSNSELIYDDPIVAPAAPEPKPEETQQDKLTKSPKSSKRKKEEAPMETPAEEAVEPPAKSPKSKRPKVKLSDKPKEPEVSVEGPNATDLQVAEALIQLPETPVVPPKVATVDQETVEVKSNNSSPVHSKTINPRKRHLQKLMDTAEVVVEQPKTEIVTIPEKKKRETIVEVVSVAPATIVHDLPVKSTNVVVASVPSPDEDKFDIDNIPIVMDDSELLEDSTISTTSNSKHLAVAPPPDDDVKLISTTKPMTKKIVIVKSSNGSAKIVGRKDSPAVAKKNLAIKSTTITIKPPLDQLSPTNVTRSPAHSPTPIRSAQLVQASSGGQIVITSKGTVLTTQSPSTSTARSQSSSSDGLKTHVSQSHSKTAIVSSVVSSASSISSSSSSSATKGLSESAANSTPNTPQRSGTAAAVAIKSPAKICVQSQEIIHPPTKPRPVVTGGGTSSSPVVVQKVTAEVGQHKKGTAAALRKSTGKKQVEPSTSAVKPLFSTSKGALITPQPATTSAVNPGKKNHRVIKISPQKLKEFTRLGMVEDKGKGKVLTASGMKKFRQEQEQLLQQQQQQQQKQRPQSKPDKPIRRPESVDEEPSTSTPTPPPSSDTPAEVVVAAAADSSVKELPPTSPPEPEQSPEVAEEEPAKPEIVEENEAAAAETEPECSSSSKIEPVPAAEDANESASTQPEVPAEANESSSNVQESSQLIAVPAENFGGPANLFYLCSVREEGFVPVNNELLYLDSSNQLVALPEQASVEDIVQQAAAAGQEVLEIPGVAGDHAAVDVEGSVEAGQQNILLNTQDGQQIILDQQSLMALAAAGADTSQLLTPDGQQIVLQGSAQELLAALAVTQPGIGIALATEGTQIIVAPESLIDLQDAPLPGEIIQVNPNTTVETNAVLTKPPIMSTVEVPSKNGNGTTDSSTEKALVDPVATTNLDESLAAVIGLPGNPNVPTSLELPITVTNPVIAKTTTSKINPIYQPTTAIAAIPGVINLPPTALAQTGTDSSHVETTHESSSSDDTKAEHFKHHPEGDDKEAATTANGKSALDGEDHDVEPSDLDDEIIPNTPESQMNSHAEISSQFSDDEDEDAPVVPLPRVIDDDDNSNFSDVIPIQPNVILRNINNELINNNETSNNSSSDMELEPAGPGNEENDPNQTAEVATGSTNNNSLVER